MSIDIDIDPWSDTRRRGEPRECPPTAPCSVVWSRGHAFVLESVLGRARWVGVDDRGRPVSLSDADLRRRGWSRSRGVA